MRVKVKKGFIDKYTKEEYFPGEKMTVSDERYKELENYVIPVKEEEKEEEQDTEKTEHTTRGRKKTS